jgi:hypothetical protein
MRNTRGILLSVEWLLYWWYKGKLKAQLLQAIYSSQLLYCNLSMLVFEQSSLHCIFGATGMITTGKSWYPNKPWQDDATVRIHRTHPDPIVLFTMDISKSTFYFVKSIIRTHYIFILLVLYGQKDMLKRCTLPCRCLAQVIFFLRCSISILGFFTF